MKVEKCFVLKIEMEKEEASAIKKIAASKGETVQQTVERAVKKFLSKGVQTTGN